MTMLNVHEVESAIRELENGSATYNNCMKLASLYIVRDELKKKENMYTYGYHPMNGNNRSSYGYREPMYYENNDELMIKKDNPSPGMSDYRRM